MLECIIINKFLRFKDLFSSTNFCIGILKAIIDVFAENMINLTALDSHRLPNGVKFMIGEDPDTSQAALDQARIRLTELGFKVEKIQNPQ